MTFLRAFVLRPLVLLLVAPAVLVTAPPPVSRRLMPLLYREGRPTSAGRRVNLIWSWLVSNGLTPAKWPGTPTVGPATLEVRGRRSGRPRSNMVTWVEHEGDRYFVSMLGERSEWVRNLRAAAGAAVFRHGARWAVRLEEVPVGLRAPIIQAWYRRTYVSTRYHFGIDPKASIEAFERVAPTHPVYRIVFADESKRQEVRR
jgi:deazaflavin-dependent oxidoreductase (nitroreductase family)